MPTALAERNRKMSDDINWNRKTLRIAFSGNPYERYKSKVIESIIKPL